jgi:DNA-binding IclR family transcriptional regulator
LRRRNGRSGVTDPYSSDMAEAASAGASDARRATGVQVIARAADILRTLHEAPEGLTLSQLAQEVKLARTTVFRIVQALQAEGLLSSSDRGGTLSLGPELGRLATATPASLVRIVRPCIERLSQDVNETVDLAVLYGANVRFVDQAFAGRRVRAESVIGQLYSAHSTANGKALLAALPVKTVEATLPARLPRHTANTTGSRRELLAELQRVRETGVAFDREEHELGICAVGAVVEDAIGARAAITIAAPTDRFYPAERQLAEAVLDAARRASAALGAPSSRSGEPA